MFKRAMRYMWPLRRQWAAHIVLALLASGLQLLTPWPMKFIVDSVVGNVPLPDMLANSAIFSWTSDKLMLLVGAVLFTIALAVVIGAVNLLSQRISIRARQA